MNKKVLGVIICIVVVVILCIFVVGKINSNKSDNTIRSTSESTKKSTTRGNGKVLVVYYSAQSHTEKVAEEIANRLGADIFEIEADPEYSSDDLDWNNSKSRVSREHNDKSKRNIKLKKNNPDNWDNYDTVILGYPIWWGIAAWPTDTFVKNNDFSGKKVIPFCTSFSSGIGSSAENLKDEAKGGDWQDGHRFDQDESMKNVDKWVDSLGL